MTDSVTLQVPVRGMDCVECTMHVQKAISNLPGVEYVDVFLASEKALVQLDPEKVDLPAIRKAVEDAGYSVPESTSAQESIKMREGFTRSILTFLGVVFGIVLFVVLVGEWLGLFEEITRQIPWPIGLLIVIVGGYPVFRNVVRAALKGQVIAHTLMTLGVLAALAVGEWATAAVVVFFMRVGDYVEQFTAEKARQAVKNLSAMAPQTARVERDGVDVEVPITQVSIGETVIVRPGEKIPVDGKVIAGRATLNQASITGESMPVESGPGAGVFAATLVEMGGLRIQTTGVGEDTTFGRVIIMVEEAEKYRADVQRVADKFSAYYLPVVAGIAVLTYFISRDPLATAAVLLVACSCAFALATPIAMLASIGAGARRGLMIKGGKFLELLDKADIVLLDKTGTLTLGKPEIVDYRLLVDELPSGLDGEYGILELAASAERYSEHPLAEAVRAAAVERDLQLVEPSDFESFPGLGVRANVNGHQVTVGSLRMFSDLEGEKHLALLNDFKDQGKTLLFIALDEEVVGLLAAADTLRDEVPDAIQDLWALGVERVELLTGDNEKAASELVERLCQAMEGDKILPFRANLLPEDKIAIVQGYQAQGHTVVMVGDGVNDAPALAQADVGIAMGVMGSDVAIEAAHIALMRDDWRLVPEAFRIAHRTMRVVRMNIGFTMVYNILGLSLAAFGFLSPVLAAAAQSLPDLGILVNSSRLLRQE